MTKRIGCARVSIRHEDTDRQEVDLRAAGVSADDLYVDRGASGANASRPALEEALRALVRGDTFVVTTIDRLGRSTGNILTLAEELRDEGVALQVLNLRGGDVDTSTPWDPWCSPSWPPSRRWSWRSNANAFSIR